jgi:D-sedoheptulose 7-phosphate isomerase
MAKDPRGYAERVLKAAAAAHERQAANVGKVVEAADAMASALKAGNKVLVFGNGGSAAGAQHFAAEFVGRYEAERRGWPVIALTTDPSIVTAVGNDYGFDRVFARQIEAMGSSGDVAFGISTSGNSPNVLRAFEAAKAAGLTTIALTGRGGEAAKAVKIHLGVNEERTPRIQEVHTTVLHVICELVEQELG